MVLAVHMRGDFDLSKVGKIALYATKQYAKEQDRKRKLEEK